MKSDPYTLNVAVDQNVSFFIYPIAIWALNIEWLCCRDLPMELYTSMMKNRSNIEKENIY
jgi:hypothetical protein